MPQQLGIALPSQPAPAQPTPTYSVGGLMQAKPLNTLLAEETALAQEEDGDDSSYEAVVQSLAALIKRHWTQAKQAKQVVEQDMLNAVRARRGEYTPEMKAEIARQGGSTIYMMLFATKARQAKALMTDVLIGSGSEKPWTINPTPSPDLPPEEVERLVQGIQAEVLQAEEMGLPMTVEEIRQKMLDVKESLENRVMETARIYAARAEVEIEDMMVEGDWLEALDQFLDDMMVFKTAFMKGPVVRNTPQLKWTKQPDGSHLPIVAAERKLEWERVDPFNLYPSPWSKSVHDGYLIERHSLSRASLSAMIGVDGYSEEAIREVLDQHGTGGLHEWLSVDMERASAEGRDASIGSSQSDLIDALQYWGSVSGKTLREWGMTEAEIPDEAKEYEVEAWLIGHHVIKAVVNPDPLARRPYYADGFSRLPGAFWHNSLFDVVRDCQDMCNSAARALANNLGIASGPQVGVNVDRLPAGEDITQMFPWKIWQFTNDPMGSTAKAIDFFQPSSNANELMGVFQKFSELADEYSGIPRYMTGLAGGEGGAGRTASGMSMMIGNASKQIKQLVASIDMHVISPSVERTYQWLMQYGEDKDLKGDLKIVARGALSLVTRESAQVRRNEFLMATGNPIDMQIIGIEGRAEVLRETVKGLNMNTDKVVPSMSVIKERMAMQQMQMMQQQAGAEGGAAPAAGGSGQELMDGSPTTDQFTPPQVPNQPQIG